MSSSPSDPSDELQFQTVEPVHPGVSLTSGRSCVVCRRPIQSMYFAVRDKTLCPDCARMVQAGPPGSQVARFMKALTYGSVAALAGAVVWGAIEYFSGYEVGIVAVALGFITGKAVRKGSGGRGGRGYQITAVLLSYTSIALAHIPIVYSALGNAATRHPSHRSGPLHDLLVAIFTVLVSFAVPVLTARENPIGLLLVGFALWEAWKFTRFYPIPLTGPYQVAPASAAPPPLPSSTGQASDSEVII